MNPGVILIQQRNIVRAVSQFPILPQYQNFSIVADTDGQTEFALENTPVLTGIMAVYINGVAQDPLNGDYTVAGDTLILSSPGIDDGDRVFGYYQILLPAINAPELNFQSFFYQAIQGQSIFTLSFSPNPLVYVAINGVIQDSEDYILSGHTLTFNADLDLDDKVYGVGINNQ